VTHRRDAFTLIELLIVVAIIAILAAIAVPNFLEAQTRSKVSRNMADMRSLAVGLEAYHVDSAHYPTGLIDVNAPGIFRSYLRRLIPLTTPVAYVTSIPDDVFNLFGEPGAVPPSEYKTFDYFLITDLLAASLVEFNDQRGVRINAVYQMRGLGPDRDNDRFSGAREGKGPIPYDPTNGTISDGDMKYFGPGGLFHL